MFVTFPKILTNVNWTLALVVVRITKVHLNVIVWEDSNCQQMEDLVTVFTFISNVFYSILLCCTWNIFPIWSRSLLSLNDVVWWCFYFHLDMNECTLGAGCQYTCKNTYGSFECVCPPGHRAKGDRVCYGKLNLSSTIKIFYLLYVALFI